MQSWEVSLGAGCIGTRPGHKRVTIYGTSLYIKHQKEALLHAASLTAQGCFFTYGDHETYVATWLIEGWLEWWGRIFLIYDLF